jgi:hypothetical protein
VKFVPSWRSALLPTASPSAGEVWARGLGLDVGLAALLVLIAIGVALRGVSLEAVPLSVQEAERAFMAKAVGRGLIPPDWPGDLGAALTSFIFRLGADGEWAARAVAAACGSLLLPLAYWWMRPLGRTPATVSCLLLALSPLAVGASRTAMPGAVGAVSTLLASGALLRFSGGGGWPWAVVAGAFTGLALGSDEVGVMGALAIVAFVVVDGAIEGRNSTLRRFLRQPWTLVAAVLAFIGAVVLGAVRYGAGPDGFWSPGLQLWAKMLELPGDGLPRHLVLGALLGYEPLLLAIGVLGSGWLVLRWWRDARALAPGERMLLIWVALAALALALASHRHVGQLLALVLPWSLIGGTGIAHALAAVPWRELRRTWPMSVPLLGGMGMMAVVLGRWARPWGESGWVEAAGFWLLGAALLILALGGWAVLGKRAAPPLVLVGALLWLAISLHGASSLGFRTGHEFVRGPLPTLSVTPLLRQIQEGVEGPLGLDEDVRWLGWHLRHRPLVVGDPTTDVQLYIGQVDMTPLGFIKGEAWTVAVAPSLPPLDPRAAWRWFLLREPPRAPKDVQVQVYLRS